MGDNGLMVAAVNGELETLPDDIRTSALAVLACKLAAKVDADDWSKAGELRRTLAELRRQAKPPRVPAQKPAESTPAPAEPEEVPERDFLDDLQADRAARRDDLAPRRARRAAATDLDRAGDRPRSAGDGRA